MVTDFKVTMQTTLYNYLYNNCEEYWIKDYCTKNYKEITFNDFWSDCVNIISYKPNSDYSKYLYDKYFIGDSVIREHIFEALSEIFKVDYNDIYEFIFHGDISVLEKIKYNQRKTEKRQRQNEYFYKDRNKVNSEIAGISYKNNYGLPDIRELQNKYRSCIMQIKELDDEMRYIEQRFEDVNYHTECEQLRQNRLGLYKEILNSPYY